MSRSTQDVSVTLPTGRRLSDVGTVGSVGALRLRVRGAHVDAYSPIASSFSAPPRFKGQLRTEQGLTVIAGRIRESLTNALWTRLYLFVLALMVVLVGLGVLGFVTSYASGGLPPLLIGLFGLPAFGWLYAVQRRQRQRDWHLQSAALAAELERYAAG